ncbi:MAG: type II toxin-antitoxin system Phd/YefM family antitoxin, partial [Alphaproteobacteria bacterium]|nr:type II toxin-antitoxin system Phd/YefM family antitoxin [Alphaproteobacteria bacterium]
MNKPKAVAATEFTRNFGRYRMRAQREPVAVSSHGRVTGYFIGPEEYEEFRRYRDSRRSFATVELPEGKVKKIAATRMDR